MTMRALLPEEIELVAGGDETVAASGTVNGQTYSSVTYHCDGSTTFNYTNGGQWTAPPPTDARLRRDIISKC